MDHAYIPNIFFTSYEECVCSLRTCVCVKGDSQPLKHCSKTVPYKIFIHTYADVVLDVVYMPVQNQHDGFL